MDKKMRILAKIFLAIATLTIEIQYTIFKIFHCEIPNFLSKDVTLKKKKKVPDFKASNWNKSL